MSAEPEKMMFERFTEAARRSLFFARAKTSERGGHEISAEDLLGGFLLAAPEAVLRFASEAADRLRPEEDGEQWLLRVEAGNVFKTPTTREIPFSPAVKRILQTAMEEVDDLHQKAIRPEHLLLGLLRYEGTDASRTLHAAGISLRQVRRIVGEEGDTGEPPTNWWAGPR